MTFGNLKVVKVKMATVKRMSEERKVSCLKARLKLQRGKKMKKEKEDSREGCKNSWTVTPTIVVFLVTGLEK